MKKPIFYSLILFFVLVISIRSVQAQGHICSNDPNGQSMVKDALGNYVRIDNTDTTQTGANPVNLWAACCAYGKHPDVNLTAVLPDDNYISNKPETKLDCRETPDYETHGLESTFDEDWASLQADNLPAAVALVDGMKKKMTGWFTLDGVPGVAWNEFGSPNLIRGEVGNMSTAYSFAAFPGGATLVPSTVTSALTQMDARLLGMGSPAVGTYDSWRYPVLIRAFYMYKCPTVSSLHTYQQGNEKRCAVASQIDVVMKIEQFYKHVGERQQKTVFKRGSVPLVDGL
jgi:hypothetical protein